MKTFNKCKTCGKNITGVEKWDADYVYCVKCFRVIEKELRRIKEENDKNWYNPNWTEGEYYNYIFDHFC